MECLKKWTFIVFLILLQNRKLDTMILKNNNIFTLHFSLFFFKKHTLMYLRCKQNCIWFCCRHLKSFFGVRVLSFFLYSRVFVCWSEFLLFQNQISGVISAKNKKVNKLQRMHYNQNVRSTFSYGIREWCKIRTNLNIFIPTCTFNLINTFQ